MGQCACAPTTHKYRTHYRIFDLFLSSPHAWLRQFEQSFVIMLNTGLDQLALVLSFTEALKEICQEIKALREDVNQWKDGDLASQPSRSEAGSSHKGAALTPQSGLLEATERIPGTTWAKEMDALDPILDEERDVVQVVEVSLRTEECIRTSFQSLLNATRQTLQSKFI